MELISPESQPTREDLDDWLLQYADLSQQYQAAVAAKVAQIKMLEAEIAQETSHLTFQMETLESLIKPLILAIQQTRKVPFVTAVYQRRDKWDREILFAIAKEVPAVMTAYTDASFVQFRKTAR